MKILFVLKQSSNNGPYSSNIKSGLLNSASFVANFLKNELNYETKVVTAFDGNAINKEIYEYKPQIVILEAIWCPPYKLKELAALYPKMKWVVRVHSKTPFLSNEGIAIGWLNEYNEIKNVEISFNSRGTNKDFKRLGFNTVYLPNIYYPTNKLPVPNKDIDAMIKEYEDSVQHKDKIIHIGCFGAIRPMKNQLNQAIAAITYANKNNLTLLFHINSARIEQKGEQVLKNIKNLFENSKHKLVEWGWLKHEDFYYLVSKMNLGLQVSLSESFNIVTADFVDNEVPMVPGKDITWMPKLLQANPLKVNSILFKIRVALFWKKFTTSISSLSLDLYNLFAAWEWISFLNRKSKKVK